MELLRSSEGKTLEFKRDLSSPEGVLRTVAAFANTAGGMLLVGVEDGSARVCGIEHPLETEERLINLLCDRISPRIVPDIGIHPWRSRFVLAVQVFPSPLRPHHLTRLGPDAGTYVRAGSTNRRADADLIAEMRRTAAGTSYDEQPLPELDSEAVDFRVASESFAGIRELRRNDLETLRLLTLHQGRLVPTVGGVLLYGTDRSRWFPDAWIQAGRFLGTDRSRILDHEEIRTFPTQAVEEAIRFVAKHSVRGIEITAVRGRARWNLPPIAVREAVVNAVVHADYSQRGAPIRIAVFDDRLEVENPGLLPAGITIDDLARGVSKLRNRVIGRVFHALGLVEQWGSGVQRMAAACREAGLPPPGFEEIGIRFRATISGTPAGPPMLDGPDGSILEALQGGVGLSTSEIADIIHLTPRATLSRLTRLVGTGLLRVIGTGPRDPGRRYHLALRSGSLREEPWD